MSSQEIRRRLAHQGVVEPNHDAEMIFEAVVAAMAGAFPPAAVGVLGEVTGGHDGMAVESDDTTEEVTVGDMFEDVAARLDVEQATAAIYARAVAEAVKSAMSEAQIERLSTVLSDDFLALFEVAHRGELTDPDGETPGAARVDDQVDENPAE